MIVAKTECKTCIHRGICKHEGNVDRVLEKLKNMTYGDGPNDDYSWDIMMQHKNVTISLSCPDYKNGGLTR